MSQAVRVAFPTVERMEEDAARIADELVDQVFEALRRATPAEAGKPSKTACLARAAAALVICKAVALHVINEHGFPEGESPGAMNLILEDIRKLVLERRKGREPAVVH